MAKKGSASTEKKAGDKKSGDKKGKQGNSEVGEDNKSTVMLTFSAC
jgi:hypothetical protein